MKALHELWSIGEEGGLELRDNDALESLEGFESLGYVGDHVTIVDNATLPTCEAERIAASIGLPESGRAPTISGNDDAGTCPP